MSNNTSSDNVTKPKLTASLDQPKPAESKTSLKEDALKHLATLENHALLQKGKPGQNPFVFLNDNVYSLMNQIKELPDKEDISKDLHTKVLALKSPEDYGVPKLHKPLPVK